MGAKEPILRENTVAFVVAKLCVPMGEGPTDLLLEAWHIAPVPGDPVNDDYDARLIDFEMPLVFALGTVGTVPDGVSGGVITFPVTVTDFVRGSVRETVLRYVFDVDKIPIRRGLITVAVSVAEWTSPCHAGRTSQH